MSEERIDGAGFLPSYTGLRRDLLRHVHGEGLTVLDLGCATGRNGRHLLERGVARRVLGVELDPAMAAEARRHYERVLGADLDQPAAMAELEGESFDCVLAGDVLEHLREPERLLGRLTALLSPGGRIIVSVPNVQHLETFIQLYLRGTWPREERGLFDRTHVRFFTRRNLLELLTGAGLVVERLERRFRFRDRVGSRFPLGTGPLLKRLFPNLFTHQYVAVCRRADAPARGLPAPSGAAAAPDGARR